MTTTPNTAQPADAALLREEADLIDAWVERARTASFQVISGVDAARTRAARLRALAAVLQELERIATGDWAYLSALADAQRYNGDGAQYFTGSHARIVERMTQALAEIRSHPNAPEA